MKTRFDNGITWETGCHGVVTIKNMETTHLMNTISMFIRKPQIVASLLIRDIENSALLDDSMSVWSSQRSVDATHIKRQSIHQVTSLSSDELTTYALNSPLGQAMLAELDARGVNVQNFVEIASAEVAYES